MDTHGKRNYTMQFRHLDMTNISIKIELFRDNIHPTALASGKTINLLDGSPVVENDRAESPSSFGLTVSSFDVIGNSILITDRLICI